MDLHRGPGTVGRLPSMRVQSALIVGQFALCLSLLNAGGFMMTSFMNIVGRDYGFVGQNLWTLHLTVPLLTEDDAAHYVKPEARVGLYRRAVRHLSELPGVVDAAAVTGFPGSELGYLADTTVTATLQTAPAAVRACSKEYFRTMQVPLIAGRMFEDTQAPEAVVNATLARKLWPTESPLGTLVSLPAGIGGIVRVETPYRIVGVVGDIRVGSVPAPELFVPIASARGFWTDIVFRTSSESPATGATTRESLKKVAPGALVEDVLPIRQVFGRQLSLARAQSMTVVLFGALSAMLAGVGLYSLLSYVIARRNTEFAVRRALGAPPSSIVWAVIRHGMLLAFSGAVIGLAGSWLTVRLLRTQLFGLQRTDMTVTAIAATALLALAVLTAYSAGRRAVRREILPVLKAE
jgi:putative ABC transport system permease protein